MRYSNESRDRNYIKGYRFLSFTKIMDKSLSSKYGQKPLDATKTFATNALNTDSKRALQRAVEATGDLIRNKTAEKITKADTKNTREDSRKSL